MAGKAVAQEKKTAKKKANKGDSLVCEVCGSSVVVEEVGGIAVSEESTLFCCGKPMKEKSTARKATKK